MNVPRDTVNTFLIVDDDDIFRSRLAKSLRARSFEVFEAASTAEAMQQVSIHNPRYIVTDLKMPGRSGLELVKELKAKAFNTEIVVFTGYGSIATAVEAVRAGAAHYLSKPADVDEILSAFPSLSDQSNRAAQEKVATPSLSQVEWEHIQRVLKDCGGNITKTADKLGIHRRSLQRKLEKLP